jgi:hypothetical protein
MASTNPKTSPPTIEVNSFLMPAARTTKTAAQIATDSHIDQILQHLKHITPSLNTVRPTVKLLWTHSLSNGDLRLPNCAEVVIHTMPTERLRRYQGQGRATSNNIYRMECQDLAIQGRRIINCLQRFDVVPFAAGEPFSIETFGHISDKTFSMVLVTESHKVHRVSTLPPSINPTSMLRFVMSSEWLMARWDMAILAIDGDENPRGSYFPVPEAMLKVYVGGRRNPDLAQII